MIDIVKGKLNLIAGQVDSGKSAVAQNTVADAIKEGLNVIYFTNDGEGYHTEKKIYCLLNSKNPSEIKIDPKTLKPVNIKLPNNLTVIDDANNIDDIKATVREYSRAWNPHIIIIDNINFLEDHSGKSYSDKIQKIIDDLNEYSKDVVTVLATFNLLKVYESYVDDIDTNKIGNLVLLSRYSNALDVHEEHTGVTTKYNFSHNSKLVIEGMEEVF